jgi:hypothetical protein
MPAATAIRQASRIAHEIPIGSQIGLAVIVLGFVADLFAHLDPALDHDHGAVTGPQLSAHLVVFVGMTLVLIGVVVDGIRSGRRHGETATQGRHFDAIR